MTAGREHYALCRTGMQQDKGTLKITEESSAAYKKKKTRHIQQVCLSVIFLFKALLYPPVILKPSTNCFSFDDTHSHYQPTNTRISFLALKPLFSLLGTAGRAEQTMHLAFNHNYQFESSRFAQLQNIPTGCRHQPSNISVRQQLQGYLI